MTRRVFTFEYNQQFDPAMPTVEMGLSLLSETAATASINALVDSGSDATLVPVDVLESIGAKPIDKVQIRGIWGCSHSANLYLICLYIATHRFPTIQVVAVDQPDECLIGRNVLNRLEVTLNGPINVTEVVVSS